jgi:hypothetical protein
MAAVSVFVARFVARRSTSDGDYREKTARDNEKEATWLRTTDRAETLISSAFLAG